MRLSVVRRLLKEDLGPDAPSWFDGVIDVLNQFIDNTITALTGRLTFADNFSCTVIKLKFTSGTAREVSIPRGRRASGMLVMDVAGKTLTGEKWARLVNNQNVDVTLTFSEGGEADCTIIIFLE